MVPQIKANKDFNELLLTEVEAFKRDLKKATKTAMDAGEHSTWIKGLSDLSRVLTRHMPPVVEDEMPEDIPIQQPQQQIPKLEDFKDALNRFQGRA